MAIESPLNPSRPMPVMWCVRCERKVERYNWQECPNTLTVLFYFQCHGEVWTLEMSREQFLQPLPLRWDVHRDGVTYSLLRDFLTWTGEDRGPSQPFQKPIACDTCGISNLDHFYTSKRDNRRLCPACFEQRQNQQLAKEVP